VTERQTVKGIYLLPRLAELTHCKMITVSDFALVFIPLYNNTRPVCCYRPRRSVAGRWASCDVIRIRFRKSLLDGARGQHCWSLPGALWVGQDRRRTGIQRSTEHHSTQSSTSHHILVCRM